MKHAPIIEMERVLTRYPGGRIALGGVSLSVDRGAFLFLIGESGAGKSTLLSLLYGALRPAAGRLIVAGCDLRRAGERTIRALRRQCGIIFQDHRLLFGRTVFENVALPLRVIGHPVERITAHVERALDFVGLADAMYSYPETLSGGEQQRVAIARAMVRRPKLILADEPTGNLDHETARRVTGYLVELQRQGSTVIMATHDLQLLRDFPGRVVTLHAGAVVEDRHG
ncbi:MAG: ATP-binding cassette domain-containing protein [Zetaproteobacteria bacterium]|nr:MAG: ATP-binding cassette domain-containing protein [Zetaproteobacteria bacterium]